MSIEDNIKELEAKLESNSKKINENLERINKNSYVLEILRDYKDDSKRLFHILLIIIPLWVGTLVYLLYVLSK